jgi:transcriptional regulator of NAD metabolism
MRTSLDKLVSKPAVQKIVELGTTFVTIVALYRVYGGIKKGISLCRNAERKEVNEESE